MAETKDHGILNILTPAEVTSAKKAEEQKNIPVLSEEVKDNLAGYIEKCWQEAKREKVNVETQMLKNMRQIAGQYEADILAAIKSADVPEYFMMLTDAKCRAADAWIKETICQPGYKPWDIEPTPSPELPEDVVVVIRQQFISQTFQSIATTIASNQGQIDPMQIFGQVRSMIPQFEEEMQKLIKKEAKRRTEKIKDKVDDALTEGGWYEAIEEFIKDVVQLKAGFIKGPIKRKEPSLKVEVGKNGKYEVKVVDQIIDKYERRSPFNIYPQPKSTGINDGYLIDLIRLKPKDLEALKGIPGFDSEQIDLVLTQFRTGGLKEWLSFESEKVSIEGDGITTFTAGENIDCLEFWGTVQGKLLIEWGMKEKDIEPLKEYDICGWLIQKHVIGAILNPDPLKKKPFNKVSYKEKSDCFWGDGLPEIIVDCQRGCNAAARAIIQNTGIGSGPQVEVNSDRLAPGESTKLTPWRVWMTTNDQMETGKAINFYAPPMVVERLIGVYSFFSKLADDYCGIPGYAHGDSKVGGAGNALADYEKVLTPKGPVKISLLKKDDLIVNSYGSFSKVTGVYPQGESEIFRLKFGNGEHIDCDMNHRWSVRTHHDRKFQTLTTKEIFSKGLFRKTKKDPRNPSWKHTGYRPKWMIPIIDFVEFDSRIIKIDPYTMGALIGDGDHRGRLTGMDTEVFKKVPYQLGKPDITSNGRAWTHTIKGVRPTYREYGLKCKSTEKFIPEDYMYNSREIRLELLRGLMDTDGCCSKLGEVFFATSSHRLAKDFVRLVRSLGAIVCSVCEEDGGEFEIKGRKCVRQKTYRVVFNLPGEKIFHLQRKQNRVTVTTKTHTYITGIEYVGKFSATCISVDSDNELFICENFIPTHNTASGLSMLITQASRGIKGLIKDFDRLIITPTVKAQFYIEIQDHENIGIVPDFKIKATGATALLAKEQQSIRRIEFMSMTNNPVDIQLMGPEGRKYLLKGAARSLDLEEDRVVPDGQANPGLQGQNMAPQPGAQTLGPDGQPVVGQDMRMFNPAGAQQGV